MENNTLNINLALVKTGCRIVFKGGVYDSDDYTIVEAQLFRLKIHIMANERALLANSARKKISNSDIVV